MTAAEEIADLIPESNGVDAAVTRVGLYVKDSSILTCCAGRLYRVQIEIPGGTIDVKDFQLEDGEARAIWLTSLIMPPLSVRGPYEVIRMQIDKHITALKDLSELYVEFTDRKNTCRGMFRLYRSNGQAHVTYACGPATALP